MLSNSILFSIFRSFTQQRCLSLSVIRSTQKRAKFFAFFFPQQASRAKKKKCVTDFRRLIARESNRARSENVLQELQIDPRCQSNRFLHTYSRVSSEKTKCGKYARNHRRFDESHSNDGETNYFRTALLTRFSCASLRVLRDVSCHKLPARLQRTPLNDRSSDSYVFFPDRNARQSVSFNSRLRQSVA